MCIRACTAQAYRSYNQLAPTPCYFSQRVDEVCSYVHRLRQVYQHPMHVRHHMLLEGKSTKDCRTNDISQAALWSIQQLIIMAETN